VLGVLDTGADFTTIPNTTVRTLRLRQISSVRIRNADGSERESPVYVADLEFERLSFPAVSVVGSELPIALVGRDILNELVAGFDGPALTFSLARVGPPP